MAHGPQGRPPLKTWTWRQAARAVTVLVVGIVGCIGISVWDSHPRSWAWLNLPWMFFVGWLSHAWVDPVPKGTADPSLSLFKILLRDLAVAFGMMALFAVVATPALFALLQWDRRIGLPVAWFGVLLLLVIGSSFVLSFLASKHLGQVWDRISASRKRRDSIEKGSTP